MASLTARSQAAGLQTSRRSFAAPRVAARPVRKLVVRAEEATATAKPVWSVPTLDPDTPSPIFGGSTGGLLRKAQVPSGPGAPRAARRCARRTLGQHLWRPPAAPRG